MSDLEFFRPGEGGESYDPAAFDKFKEQMKKNAAFMAAARKSEQKQKEKEDKLAKILLKFIQSNQKSALLFLAAKLIQENIPPSFILSVILLGNDEIQEELRRETKDALQLPPGEAHDSVQTGRNHTQGQPDPQATSEFSLITRFSDASLPLKVKAEIDAWGKGMFDAASATPFRIFETVILPGGALKKVVVDACANVLGDYLKTQSLPAIGYDSYFSFCEFLLHHIITALKKQVENQKELQ